MYRICAALFTRRDLQLNEHTQQRRCSFYTHASTLINSLNFLCPVLFSAHSDIPEQTRLLETGPGQSFDFKHSPAPGGREVTFASVCLYLYTYDLYVSLTLIILTSLKKGPSVVITQTIEMRIASLLYTILFLFIDFFFQIKQQHGSLHTHFMVTVCFSLGRLS